MSAITLHIQIKTHIHVSIIEYLVHVTYVIVRHYSPSFSQKLSCYLIDINIVTNI